MVYTSVLSYRLTVIGLNVREVNMILSMRLHMKEATLSSMTPEVLSLVQRRR